MSVLASKYPNLQVAVHLFCFPSSHAEGPVFPGQAAVFNLSGGSFFHIFLNKKLVADRVRCASHLFSKTAGWGWGGREKEGGVAEKLCLNTYCSSN
jgi:hypothetical protein